MPELTTVAFTGTSSDAYKPTYNGHGVWTLYVPDSPETIATTATTNIDLHFDITVPADHSFSIFPVNAVIPGTNGNTCVVPGTWQGTGAAQGVIVNCLNPSGATNDPTPNSPFAHLIVFKGLCKVDQTT